MGQLSAQTAHRIDQELAGIGFDPREMEQIAPQVGAWAQEIEALDQLDLREVEPALVYLLEEG
ncbi:MAG: hypothetical protein QHH30_04865 [candidate division NC10 bacterium]|nr:hypothetical protein [candidate division NC10 bacterium]